MVITLKQLSGAIRKRRPQMEENQAYELAVFYMNFFGFYGRILDNVLETEERDAFYQLDDIGLATTESEKTGRPEIKLVDGKYKLDWRNWTSSYWVLKEDEIMRTEKSAPEESGIEKGGEVYGDEDMWEQVRKARGRSNAGGA